MIWLVIRSLVDDREFANHESFTPYSSGLKALVIINALGKSISNQYESLRYTT